MKSWIVDPYRACRYAAVIMTRSFQLLRGLPFTIFLGLSAALTLTSACPSQKKGAKTQGKEAHAKPPSTQNVGAPAQATRPTPTTQTTADPKTPAATTPSTHPTNTATKTPPAALAGVDFIADARRLYDVAACPGHDAPTVQGFDPRVLKTHCQRLRAQMARYRKVYVEKARPFFAGLEPKSLPAKVVYPFGGGDLLSALTTYSHAREITTISLEHVGDVRRVRRLRGKKLAENLHLLRQTIAGLLSLSDSTSVNMMKMQRTPIPGQLAFFLVALSIYDFEPVSLRYFSIAKDGKLHYFTPAEIAALDSKRARRLSGGWVDPTGSPAFSNAELRFRRRGDPSAPILVHRHVAANLANRRQPKDGPLLRHLGQKGPIVSMTKAAAYMIWRHDFSHIRDLLLEKMVYMVSDSTGIPPSLLKTRGFRVTTFGRYRQCFFEKRFDPKTDEEFVRLWRRNRYRRLPFRYGYPDRKGHWHMMIASKTSL